MMRMHNWASKASPTLGCSIEISRDIYINVGMSVVCQNAQAELRDPITRMLKVSLGWLKQTDTCVTHFDYKLEQL